MEIDGLRYLPDYFNRSAQQALLDEVRAGVVAAPLYTPTMPRTGKPFSVRMTNLGPLGWVSDRQGYRYQPEHPETGNPWPPIPEALLDLWHGVSDYPAPPQACLVNFYQPQARMGLHRDEDEQDFSAPVVSVSLGDSAVFRIGGLNRKDKTRSIKLHSGDVVVLGGPARLIHHGIDRIIPGTSTLFEKPGRLNLTLRRVTQ